MYDRFSYFREHRDPTVRVGDAEREALADQLRRHHAEGRLDADEFQERLDRCYAAKTGGELDQLVADLPPERKPQPRLRLRWIGMSPLIPIVLAIILISAATGDHDGHFAWWVVIPLFFIAKFWFWGRRPWRWRRYTREEL